MKDIKYEDVKYIYTEMLLDVLSDSVGNLLLFLLLL